MKETKPKNGINGIQYVLWDSFTLDEVDDICNRYGLTVEELKRYDGLASVFGDYLKSSGTDNVVHITNNSNYGGHIEIPSTVTYKGKTYLVVEIYKRAFYNAQTVLSVTLPDSIRRIETSAFLGSTRFSRINFPKNLLYIGDCAFTFCHGLVKVILPDKLVELQKGTMLVPGDERGDIFGIFQLCQNIEDLTIGSGMVKMDQAFTGCSALKTVICKATTPPAITESTFTNKAYQNATLYVPFLSLEAYKKATYWNKFSKIEPIPETIPTTDQFYFMVDGIRYMTKGGNSKEVYVAPLEEGVYSENTLGSKMSGVYVAPDASKTSHRPTSPRAPKKAGLEIPSQVKYANKTYTVTGIGKYAFRDSKIATIKLPDTVKDIDYAAFKNANITSIEIPGSVQFIKDSAFFGCENLTEIDIPGSVSYVEDSAFGYCNNLKKIVLHKGLNIIGECAFEGAKEVQQLTIPDTVHEIGASAFYQVGYNNPNRLALTIPDSVLTIGNNAFFECRLKSLTLGKGLKRIEDGVFRKSELKELVIPEGITSIGKKAFADNGNSFQTITCESSTPPKIQADTFDSKTFENATLNVPYFAFNNYKEDPVWGRFDQIKELKPANAEMISEPIRYISLSNDGALGAKINVQCENGTFQCNNIIDTGQKETIDLADVELIQDGCKVRLKAVVVKGKNSTAKQIFTYGASSNKKANYSIQGNMFLNFLNYKGIEESK